MQTPDQVKGQYEPQRANFSIPQPFASGQTLKQRVSGQKDFGAAPQGSREGRTGKLPDGTAVVVRNGRLIAQ
jgi:hypothetical protein